MEKQTCVYFGHLGPNITFCHFKKRSGFNCGDCLSFTENRRTREDRRKGPRRATDDRPEKENS